MNIKYKNMDQRIFLKFTMLDNWEGRREGMELGREQRMLQVNLQQSQLSGGQRLSHCADWAPDHFGGDCDS